MSLMLNPGCCAAVIRMRSCLAMRAAQPLLPLLQILDRHGAMLIGVNQIIVGCFHAVKRHWPPKSTTWTNAWDGFTIPASI